MAFKLLTSCLEASANLHLKPILENLPEYELFGIFDESLGEPLLPSSSFGVMGFIDVLGKIKIAKKAIHKMAQMSLQMDKVLLIDSPAFNIPLARAIRKINPNIKITYYILPQVWAWKAKRAKEVDRLCDNLASILPFEKNFYTKAKYVGNPLIDEIKDLKTNITNYNTISFLPGSRKAEIKKLMPIFRQVLPKFRQKSILVIPNFFKNSNLEDIYGDTSGFEISYNTHEALQKSDFAYICSGTASLEAALIGTPFVLVYKAKWLDFFIAKTFVKLKHIGLGNIIFDFENLKPLHDELLQEQVNPERLLESFEKIDKKKFLENALKLRKILDHGSAKEVSQMILV